jgi:ribonuclease R
LVWHGHLAPEDGDFCVAEVPDDAPAFLVEVLGADDRPAWDDLSVTSQFRLRSRFPERVLDELGTLHEPTDADCRRRVDLRDRLVFTIDPEDARDHDDALSVRSLGHGRYEVGIHIADVSHYVAEDGAIDREAERRGTSCYLPGGVVPMLPERLSGDLCSLREGVDRLALSVIADLDHDGELHGVRYEETAVRSRHRLHYGEVQAAFDGAGHFDAPLRSALETLRDLARGLRGRRRKAGALELEVPETKVRVDAQGVPLHLERRLALESHGLIEEFMLLANRCVGEEGARRRSGLLYRIHDPPAPAKLAELDAVLRALSLPHPGAIADPARALQSLLRVSLDPARRRLLHRMVLRSLARAQYLERDVGHFGLATRSYCHFTSPIRRYPDLHNHRRVREWLRGRRSGAWDPIAVADRAIRCTAAEQNATDAEREAVRVKSLRYLGGRLGEEASGIITGLIPRGMFVELDDVPAEGFVRVMEELDDQFVLDRLGVRLVGRRSRRRFTLGDAVRVIIARVDVPARECDFALAEPARRRRRHGRA